MNNWGWGGGGRWTYQFSGGLILSAIPCALVTGRFGFNLMPKPNLSYARLEMKKLKVPLSIRAWFQVSNSLYNKARDEISLGQLIEKRAIKEYVKIT